MLKQNRYYHFIVVMALFLAAGCASTNQTSRINLAFLYHPEKQFANLESVVYHLNDTASDIYVKVNFSDLLYAKDPFSGLYICSYRLSCKMWKGYEEGEVVFFSSELSGDSINYGRNAGTIHSFQLPARYPGNYIVALELFDMNRKASTVQYVNILKSDRAGRQNFLVFGQEDQLLFRTYLYPDQGFKIVTDDREQATLTVNCYFRDFPLARPPYLEDREPVFNYLPDSVFLLPLSSGQTGRIALNRRGFYHIRKDTTRREGLTLFIFEEGFPEIFSAEQLREPLKYITTKKEFDSLMASSQPKAAVDNFWLTMAGSPERAKSLIQKYYGNVEESNLYFTSYHEGWKTDRGLIYTVLGKPNYVYRSDDSEEWIYGEPQHRSSLRFTFLKVKNPFSDNDFMLLRSPTFKEPWFITVQSWRR